MYSREGPYLGVHGVALFEHARGGLDVSNSGGVSESLGYRMAPELAFEMFGEWVSLGGRNPWSLGLHLKLFPLAMLDMQLLDDRLQFFGIATMGIQQGQLGRDNKPGGNFRIGVGGDYWLTERLALTSHIQYSGGGGQVANLRSTNITIGVLWRFGGDAS